MCVCALSVLTFLLLKSLLFPQIKLVYQVEKSENNKNLTTGAYFDKEVKHQFRGSKIP